MRTIFLIDHLNTGWRETLQLCTKLNTFCTDIFFEI